MARTKKSAHADKTQNANNQGKILSHDLKTLTIHDVNSSQLGVKALAVGLGLETRTLPLAPTGVAKESQVNQASTRERQTRRQHERSTMLRLHLVDHPVEPVQEVHIDAQALRMDVRHDSADSQYDAICKRNKAEHDAKIKSQKMLTKERDMRNNARALRDANDAAIEQKMRENLQRKD